MLEEGESIRSLTVCVRQYSRPLSSISPFQYFICKFAFSIGDSSNPPSRSYLFPRDQYRELLSSMRSFFLPAIGLAALLFLAREWIEIRGRRERAGCSFATSLLGSAVFLPSLFFPAVVRPTRGALPLKISARQRFSSSCPETTLPRGSPQICRPPPLQCILGKKR